MMPAGLCNRLDVFFDPDHVGWFSSLQAAKDVTLALDLAKGGAPLPVTEAEWQRLVTLPLFPDLTESEIAQVIDGVRSFRA